MSQEISGCVEQLDDGVRKAREIVKRGNDRLARDKASFIDRYLSGEFHLVLRRAFPDESDCGFLIVHHHEAVGEGFVAPQDIGTGDLKISVIRDHGEKFSMLTHDVELVKSPKLLVPSFVRFQRFQAFPGDFRQRVYEFRSLELPLRECVGAPSDWKIDILKTGYATVSFGERRREDIQAAPQDIQVSADLDVEAERKRLFLAAYYDVVRAIRIVIYDFSIEVGLEPGVNPLSQGWELGFGPIDAGYGV
jgi:hypothetical protein